MARWMIDAEVTGTRLERSVQVREAVEEMLAIPHLRWAQPSAGRMQASGQILFAEAAYHEWYRTHAARLNLAAGQANQAPITVSLRIAPAVRQEPAILRRAA